MRMSWDTELVDMTCPCCGVQYGLEKKFRDYRLQGGMIDGKKAGWYCPNGHHLTFTESEADKLRRERDRLKQENARLQDAVQAEKRRASAQFGENTKLRKRISAGTCPCCHRTFQQLARHMAQKHPTFTAEAAE